MTKPSPATIARRLSRGQRSTMLGLDHEYSVLGCSEPWAIRLKADRPNRPALVKEGPRSVENWRTFALTEIGLAVREELTQ